METAKNLDQLLDLLSAEEPRVSKARAILKEMVVKGPCREEVDVVRGLLTALVEQLLKPLAADNRGRQIQVDRLLRAIKEQELPTATSLAEPLGDVAQWVKALGATDEKGARDQPPPNFFERLLGALRLLGQEDHWLLEALQQLEHQREEGRLSWDALHALLGRIITQGEIAHASWRQERDTLKRTLAEVATRFAETLHGIGEVDHGMTSMVERLAASDQINDLVKLKELLIQEAGTLQRHALALSDRVRESQALVEKSQQRLHQMEEQLSQSRDRQLQDPFTGLPNKFAFIAHLDRHLERVAQLEEPFCIAYMQLDNLRQVVADLGRDVGRRLVAALAQRLRKEIEEPILLARLAEDRFALLFPAMGVKGANRVVERLFDLLDNTRFRLNEQTVQVRGSFALVGHQPGVTAKLLLRTANETLYLAARKKEGKRLLIVHPEAPAAGAAAEESKEAI